MADFTGGDADDTFTASATVGTTAATTVNSGDTLDGGAGKDTLTITATADNNRSLTGLAVSNIETINLIGANNFGTSTTTTSAPAVAVGAKQVQVLDIANLSLQAEQQTVSYVGLAKNATAGTLSLTVLGQTVTTAEVAADASAATIATAVATAINASTAVVTGTSTVKSLVTASATSGVVTLKFAASVGDAVATTQTDAGLVTALTTSATAPTITETVASSAEIQTVDLTGLVKKGAGAAEFSVLGQTVATLSIADDATAGTIANAVALAINTAAGTGGNANLLGKVKAEVVNTDDVKLTFSAPVGDAAASALKFSLASANTVAIFDNGTTTDRTTDVASTETRKGAQVDLAVTVNGAQYATKVALDPSILTATSTALTTAQNANKDAARNAIKSVLAPIVGDAFEIGNSDEAGEIKLTSKTVGTAAPTITATGRDSASNLILVDADDAATVANVVKTGATALAQQVQYTVGGTVAADDTFTLYINGANLGNVVSGNTTAANAATNIVAALNAALGTGVASAVGAVITVTAPVAGTALPLISIKANDASGTDLTLVRSDVRDNAVVGSTTTTTALGAASVAASTFVGAEVINLSGASNSTSVSAVAAGQTVGFTGLSSIVSTVGFASTVTNGLLSTTGSSGAVTVTGSGLTSLSLAGTTAGSTSSSAPTVLSLTEGVVSSTGTTTVDTIKALNVSTSGTTVLNTVGLSELTSVTQSGAGGIVLNETGTAAKLAKITTGAGADNIRVTTAVAADTVGTTIDETVTAVVSTGAGNDRVIVKTGATATNGITTVDLGDGNDTLILDTINSGANTISGGADNDTFRIGNISTLASTSISGGTGTDVLRTSDDTITTADYTTLTANVSSVETLQLTANAVSLDASRVAMGRIEFLGTGTNTVTEVSSAQTLAAVRTSASAASFGIAEVGAPIIVENITATSKGYVAETVVNNVVTVPTVFGDNLNIAMTHVASTGSVVAKGAALTLSVTALGDTSLAAASAAATAAGTNVEGISSKVTLTGDVQSATVTLASARGVGTTATPAALGEEEVAKLNIVLDADGEGTTNTVARTLGNLQTVTVSGAGEVTIDARTDLAATAAKLTTINLSGMTAFADLNDKGQEIGTVAGTPNTIGGYKNLSKSTVTLDNQVAETVVLGGGRDTVVTGSTIVKTDIVTGFQVTASADPLVVDTTRSDELKIGVAFNGTAGTIDAAKMTVTGSTLEAALLQAAGLKTAAGADVENVVFHFGGNTYVYVDTLVSGVGGLDDTDKLVQLSGTLNLDLLLQSGVVIA